jgi:hypothetical protein
MTRREKLEAGARSLEKAKWELIADWTFGEREKVLEALANMGRMDAVLVVSRMLDEMGEGDEKRAFLETLEEAAWL